MGQLIEFRPKKAVGKSVDSMQRNEKISKDGTGAKVLFFTGVRYERQASSPSERLRRLAASTQAK